MPDTKLRTSLQITDNHYREKYSLFINPMNSGVSSATIVLGTLFLEILILEQTFLSVTLRMSRLECVHDSGGPLSIVLCLGSMSGL